MFVGGTEAWGVSDLSELCADIHWNLQRLHAGIITFKKGEFIRGRTIPNTRTGWGQPAEKQLGRRGPGSQGCQQTDHEASMCPWSKKGRQPPELHQAECCQQAEGDELPLPCCFTQPRWEISAMRNICSAASSAGCDLWFSKAQSSVILFLTEASLAQCQKRWLRTWNT